MIKVAAFTGGHLVPSARFRVRQYIPLLKQNDILMEEFSSKFGQYPPLNKFIRPVWAIATLAERLPAIMHSFDYDVTFLQREFMSTFATFEHLTKRPRVFDVDDAIWLYKDGNFTRKLARISSGIICGNQFIADWFSHYNENIFILPTAVNTARFIPGAKSVENEKIIIGWTGTSSNFKYLYSIESAFSAVLEKNHNIILRIVADGAPLFKNISPEQIEVIPWSAEKEVQLIQEMDIGIMPLDMSDWSLGKCSYKMLLYMSCETPVVVTSVGMNIDVLELGGCGFGVSTVDEWYDAIEALVADSCMRLSMGRIGRQIVEKHYSVDSVSHRLAHILQSVV